VSRGEHGSSSERIRIHFLVQGLEEKIEGPGEREERELIWYQQKTLKN
jgi:hypothetical protein